MRMHAKRFSSENANSSSPFDKRICIIGGGVSGLSCGIELLKSGYSVVHLLAKSFSPHTTSDIAAAVWRPYHMMPEKLAMKWAMESLKIFKYLSKESASGVTWMNLTEVYRHKRQKPEWMQAVDCLAAPTIPNYYSCAFRVRVPLIDTALYMPYLLNKFQQLGGVVTHKFIHNLQEVDNYGCIINCSGIGSRQLVHDHQVFPLKGHVVQVTKPDGVDEGIADYEQERIYIYPRHNDCIIGSTSEENQWELSYDMQAAESLFERAKILYPALKSAEIIAHRVGFRPSRKEIKLYAEPLSLNTLVVHNYGHGGRGFTLSWGCARRVIDILSEY